MTTTQSSLDESVFDNSSNSIVTSPLGSNKSNDDAKRHRKTLSHSSAECKRFAVTNTVTHVHAPEQHPDGSANHKEESTTNAVHAAGDVIETTSAGVVTEQQPSVTCSGDAAAANNDVIEPDHEKQHSTCDVETQNVSDVIAKPSEPKHSNSSTATNNTNSDVKNGAHKPKTTSGLVGSTRTPVTQNDPLGMFSTEATKTGATSASHSTSAADVTKVVGSNLSLASTSSSGSGTRDTSTPVRSLFGRDPDARRFSDISDVTSAHLANGSASSGDDGGSSGRVTSRSSRHSEAFVRGMKGAGGWLSSKLNQIKETAATSPARESVSSG